MLWFHYDHFISQYILSVKLIIWWYNLFESVFFPKLDKKEIKENQTQKIDFIFQSQKVVYFAYSIKKEICY